MKLKPTPEAILCNQVGVILIALALAIAAGRIAVVRSAEGDTAFLSANDRSRWATVAALVEDGTYEIDRLVAITDKSGRRRPWNSIDRVQHTGSDGRMHHYSSKPPLLATLVAGVYAGAKSVLGMTLTEQPIYMTRIVLALVNLPVLWIFLAAIRSVIQRSALREFSQLAVVAAACFGTMLLPMSVSLNNHLPAAAATAVVLLLYLRREGRYSGWPLIPDAFWAGAAAAFTVTCELPALLMLVLWLALFLRQNVLSTLIGFVPGAAIVTAAFFGTNWIAHGTLIPPYAHRSDGPVLVSLVTEQASEEREASAPPNAAPAAAETSADAVLPSAEQIGAELRAVDALHPRNRDEPLRITPTADPDRWLVETAQGHQRFALRRDATAEQRWNLHRWDNWYDYPGSYWTTPRRGVDRGEPNRGVYAFQLTLGYYGLFSLTPIWTLVPVGMYLRFRERRMRSRWWLNVAIIVATLVCLAFYISRPLIDRNYGGVSSSFRWMLWFAPLWLWALLPAAQLCGANRWGRWLLVLLLAGSVFSVAMSLESPWQHPWIYRYVNFLGWLKA